MIEQLEWRLCLSTTWYVAANGGSNAYPGTLAQPFQTIQAAANIAQAGDYVLIEGGAYHETVKPVNSGTASAPITYEPYAGQAVTLDGADPITGWTQYSGSIYAAPQGWDLGDGNNQVIANGGQMLVDARWPNTGLDPLNIGAATITTTNAKAAAQNTQTTATFTNPALNQAAGYWVGATLHFSPGQQWVWETGTVTASTPGSITVSYTQLTSYEVPKAGNPFYLTGKFSQLDSPGEFYHDSTTNTLYVYLPDGSAPTNNIEAKHRQYAFDLSGLSYINLNSFYIRSATINTSAASSHIGMSIINAAFISSQMDNAYPWGQKNVPHTTGILLNGSYNVLSDSYIAYSSGDGVYLGGSHNTVINSTIIYADYAGGDEAGVSVQGANNQVYHDNINNVGRSGVTFYFAGGTGISNNAIYNCGVRGSDSGGVYTWMTDGNGSRVDHNEIFNMHAGGFGNSGILLDNNTSNITVDHNLIFNVDAALKMNATSTNDLIYNNTLVGTLLLNGAVTTTHALMAGATPMMVNCVFDNNIFVGSTMFLTGATLGNNITNAAAAAFIDQTNNNYNLSSMSAAIDKGLVIAPYTNNYAGAAPDIGALEYGGIGLSVGVPTVARNPYSITPAQNYDAQQGTVLTPPGVGSIDNNDWLEFGALYLAGGISTFTFQYAVAPQSAGGTLELHLDTPTGPMLGATTLASTGSFTTPAQLTIPVANANGVHDLYLVFHGGLGICNLNQFQFT